ncbi:GNAT family N-acetyltransferase [Streptomyces luteogriseus]|uniref:GNAT family N-acetyltransferase n=1 Tax=Streptomyces luteogriseus TaxID=68233 RepID=UPI0037143F52
MPLLDGVVEQDDPHELDLYLSNASPGNRFGTGLVAEADGQVIGFAAGAGIGLSLPGLQVSEEEIARRIALLDVIAVHPEHRRRGIGTVLRDAVLDHFRAAGHRLVMAKLAAGRPDLDPIYSRWGWTVGHTGAGLAVALGPDPVVLAEEPTTRVAWTALAPQVRVDPSMVPGALVVVGAFD